VADIADLARSPDDPAHLVVVNPNNPDGRLTPIAELLRAGDRCAQRGGWLIVDESFVDTEPEASVVPWIEDRPIVLLRSFGKFYGLAGLRLGFAIAPPRLAQGLAAALGPWAVSGPALAIGAAALADQGWSVAMRRRLAEESRALDAALAQTGLEIVGGTSLYRLVRHSRAAALHAALAAEHVWVRRFDWADDLLRFGLPPEPESLERLRVVLARAVPRS
jgi:cobalamin biosynthetic protein CobC